MSTREPLASPGFVETALWNHEPVTFATDPPGTLALTAGDVGLLYRLDFDHGGDPTRVAEGMVNIACLHRVADSTGAVWEARTCFHSDLFVNRMLDLDSLTPPTWAHRDPERAGVIAERPMLTRLPLTLDDRFYRRFWVDDALLEIQFKYQGLTIDVGYQDRNRVVVRVSGFFGSWCHAPLEGDCYIPPWQGGTIRPPQTDYDEEDDAQIEFPADEVPSGWLESLSPIVYSLWAREFLFLNDATWDGTHPAGAPFPRPIVFRRVAGESGTPQENVTFKPA